MRDRARLSERQCPRCQRAFQPARSTQKFCSDKCYRLSARMFADVPPTGAVKVCAVCSREFAVEPKRWHSAKYCSRSCLAKAHLPKFQIRFKPSVKDVRKTPYHQIMRNGKKVREHRYVMEQHLGRPLLAHEHVHHVDGDGWNNRIENLQLINPREHSKLHFEQARGGGRHIDDHRS